MALSTRAELSANCARAIVCGVPPTFFYAGLTYQLQPIFPASGAQLSDIESDALRFHT